MSDIVIRTQVLTQEETRHALSDLVRQLNTKFGAGGGSEAAQDAAIAALQASDTEQETDITALESSDSEQETDITDLETAVGSLQSSRTTDETNISALQTIQQTYGSVRFNSNPTLALNSNALTYAMAWDDDDGVAGNHLTYGSGGITVANGGNYLVQFHGDILLDTSTSLSAILKVNGNEQSGSEVRASSAIAATAHSLNAIGVVTLAGGDGINFYLGAGANTVVATMESLGRVVMTLRRLS